MAAPKSNIAQVRGLLANLTNVKDAVETERQRALAKQKALQEQYLQKEAESRAIQGELSVQLRCAGRSYQSLLGATRELTEQLRAEEERRQTEISALEQQVKELRLQLAQAAKPWKEEVAKRDLRIARLQEAAIEMDQRMREALAAVPREREEMEKEVRAREAKAESMLKDVDLLREQMQAMQEEYEKKFQAEKKRNVLEVTQLTVQLKEVTEASATISLPYERKIKELELKVEGLEKQLGEVDYTPYQKQVQMREAGYEKLVKDFEVKERLNKEMVQQMREGFEVIVARLDKKIQEYELEAQKLVAPWKEQVAQREEQIERLQAKIVDLQRAEADARVKEKAIAEELRKELAAVKGGLDVSNTDNYKLRRQLDVVHEEQMSDHNPHRRQIQLLEMKLDEVTTKCEGMLRQKDKELKEKSEMVQRLQERVTIAARDAEQTDQEWDRRVQAKEEGYGIVVAQLKYAEGQILEERGRTAAALATVKRREEVIERLKKEHTEELRVRLEDREQLEVQIRELEAVLDVEMSRYDDIRLQQEVAMDAFRKKCEDRVEDLRVEMDRRDRARLAAEAELAEARKHWDRTRIAMEERARELEAIIRARDRTIASLQNELEFINDSWDVKYQRLLSQFEKVQKKYAELLGPKGVLESLRRAKDLKMENEQLSRNIGELKEIIKKQKRQIRDLQLDIDIRMKETADYIAAKEKGILEMLGDFAKLENRLRDETELREKLVKQMSEEKRAIVESFKFRIEQLEQLVEAMRYTDRKELLDKIDVWKRAYERVCLERDQAEDDFKRMLDVKDLQLKRMCEDNAEELRLREMEKEIAAEKLAQVEESWKKKQTQWALEKRELEVEIEGHLEDKVRLRREVDRAKLLADSRLEDPEKDLLKKKLAEKEEQLAAVEAGVKTLIDENTSLRSQTAKLDSQVKTAAENWEPQIKWRDERYEAMMREHERVKEALTMELKVAQDNCKMIEEQVRRFPNPFEEDLKELRDRYAQMQAGLKNVVLENATLREKNIDLDLELQALRKEQERVREILTKELDHAQDNCHVIAQEVRKFAKPDEEDLRDLQDRYAQLQATGRPGG